MAVQTHFLNSIQMGEFKNTSEREDTYFSRDLKPLCDNLGLYFQIRDDLANLYSKGGKSIFPQRDKCSNCLSSIVKLIESNAFYLY